MVTKIITKTNFSPCANARVKRKYTLQFIFTYLELIFKK